MPQNDQEHNATPLRFVLPPTVSAQWQEAFGTVTDEIVAVLACRKTAQFLQHWLQRSAM